MSIIVTQNLECSGNKPVVYTDKVWISGTTTSVDEKITSISSDVTTIKNSYVTAGITSGLATESFVTNKGYVTAGCTSGLVTQQYVDNSVQNALNDCLSETSMLNKYASLNVKDVVFTQDTFQGKVDISFGTKVLAVSDLALTVGGKTATCTKNANGIYTVTVSGQSISDNTLQLIANAKINGNDVSLSTAIAAYSDPIKYGFIGRPPAIFSEDSLPYLTDAYVQTVKDFSFETTTSDNSYFYLAIPTSITNAFAIDDVVKLQDILSGINGMRLTKLNKSLNNYNVFYFDVPQNSGYTFYFKLIY